MNSTKTGLLGALLLLTSSGAAQASGLFASERGVRPLGRGGAFVAGADDLGAISYNPAGIFDAGTSFYFDASVLIFQADYTRQALLRQVDPNTGDVVATYEQTFPTVAGSATPLPLPTIAGSFILHPDWHLAIGAQVPYAVLNAYPEFLEDESPSPTRYALISMDGTVLAILGGYVAYRPVEPLTLGVGVDLLVGSFVARKYLTGCLPERFFCSTEDPEWDVSTEINAAPIITPSGSVGAIWEFYEGFRLGASFHLPYWIIAPATVKTRLPSTPVFRNSEQVGDSATIEFQIPWELRLGLEMRDLPPGLRIELAGDYHHWAAHDAITVTDNDIALTNLPGFPKEYYLPDINIDRGFQGSLGVRLGSEYFIEASDNVTVTPRLGVSYETSAVPTEYLSVLTLDASKVTASVGLGVQVGDARFDAVYAHLFLPQVVVDPATAKLTQTLPLQANPSDNPDVINGGVYNWSVDIVGLGFSYTFDRGAAPSDEAKPLPEPPRPTPAKKTNGEGPEEDESEAEAEAEP